MTKTCTKVFQKKIRDIIAETKELFRKLDKIERSSSQTAHAYMAIVRITNKIKHLSDDAFGVSIKKSLQIKMSEILEDTKRIKDD